VDPRLLAAYNEELTYLREAAREFGEENEAVAGRLGLKTPTEPDPYVERLLEGVAFLGARVSLKLQDQFPDFTQHLLNAIQPHYVAPTPSMCIVGFEPAESEPLQGQGFAIPRHTTLTGTASDQAQTPVTFRTAHDVTLWPIRIAEAEYLPGRAAVASYAGAADTRAEAGLRLRIEALPGTELRASAPSSLPVYLAGTESLPGELYRQLIGDTTAVIGRPVDKADIRPSGWSRLPPPAQTGFEDDHSLLPVDLRSFRGYRLLSEYFACPERFLFADIKGLERLFARSTGACEIVFLFSRAAPSLANSVTAANLKLFATPAINLFEKQLGRVTFDLTKAEQQLVPDRVRPLDFEVFRVLEMTAFGRSNSDPQAVAPLYARGAMLYDYEEALFYAPRLRARRLSTREQRRRRRSDYVGTETWVGITAPGHPGRLERIFELGVRALVTNRELPEQMNLGGASDFVFLSPAVRSVRALRTPTRPRPPMGMNDAGWRLIGHLTPNYATLISSSGGDASLLRDHLALYGRTDDALMRRQVDGLLSARSEHVTRRVHASDRLAFARGLKVELHLDDAAFDSGRMFLFAAVIERFLAEFATLNTFTESQFSSAQEGVFARFPPRTGRKTAL